MTVKGIYRQPIEIEVGKEELFRGLVCELGFAALFYPSTDMYSKIENKVDSNGNTTPYLVTYRDISRHGSSSYEEIGRRALTNTEASCAHLLRSLKETMSIMEENKEAKRFA